METWKDVPGYEGLYKVSTFGNVKRYKKLGKVVKIAQRLQLSKKGL